MKLIIDDANLEKIKQVYEYFPVSGVTTNPTILTKSGKLPYDVLFQIRKFIGDDQELHAQVIADNAEDMIKEAHTMLTMLGDNTFVKIPVTREGLKAIKALKKEGVNITATATYSAVQAYLAAEAGADYVAPYVNRISNLAQDGVGVVRDIQDIFRNNNYKTQVLAASFKNAYQVIELAKYGIGAATINPDIIESLVQNASVAAAVQTFSEDFHSAYDSAYNRAFKEAASMELE